ncbi:MAG: dihydroxyacetone kinase subunit L [Clostridiales bacterium]|nr:dihydroxyacetone kinase subunit L [Clostridiales bacterium]
MKIIKQEDWPHILQAIAQVMSDHAEELCQMDAQMGDGDLGLTMKKGFCALPEIFEALTEPDTGKRLSKMGMTMAAVVPSTMGTLMASGWMEGGKHLVGREAIGAEDLAAFLQGFADGIAKRGKCRPGDRTVLDSLLPAAQAAGSAAACQDLATVIASARAAAMQGVEDTRHMTPRYGKAAVFAAKAQGVRDQGAVAGMLLIQGLYNGIYE